tara:strand:- start:3057 stop:3746 length:690 start_codon:yes stop_codon:yes gene_type:complete
MTTALSIINQALRKINVVGRGQDLQNDEAQDALTALNNLMSGWSAAGGMVFTQQREVFALTGAQSYTIGSGADFDTARPIEIQSAFIRQGSTDYELNQYSVDEWARIADKSTGGIPEGFYYDNNSPTAKIYIYPIGSSSYSLVMFSKKALTSFTSLTDDISLPEGYERALVYNLACEVAIEFEKQPTGMLIAAAAESKKDVFVANTRHNRPVAKLDIASGARYNAYRGF